MTNEQAKKMLKAKLECLKRETSGTDFDCNNSNCDQCSLCYEQGNMGEQKEALDMAIIALEQEPCDDAINRSEALSVFKPGGITEDVWKECDIYKKLTALPLVTPKPKTGHWIPNGLFDDNGNRNYMCSECTHCDVHAETQIVPYCWWCGAKMAESEDDKHDNNY